MENKRLNFVQFSNKYKREHSEKDSGKTKIRSAYKKYLKEYKRDKKKEARELKEIREFDRQMIKEDREYRKERD